MLTLYQICHLQIFLPLGRLPLSFDDCFVRCAEAFYLDEVPRVHVAFVSRAFGDMSGKKLPWPRSKRILPVFSSRILMVSCLMFRSFIQFEFIFVYSARQWSSLGAPGWLSQLSI